MRELERGERVQRVLTRLVEATGSSKGYGSIL